MLIVGLLWCFTALILGIALTIIKDTMKDQTNRVTNVKAMVLNFSAFCFFAVQIFAFPTANIIMLNQNTEKIGFERLKIKVEY
jgi:hypothetical protein